jgi:hypothetical protein
LLRERFGFGSSPANKFSFRSVIRLYLGIGIGLEASRNNSKKKTWQPWGDTKEKARKSPTMDTCADESI